MKPRTESPNGWEIEGRRIKVEKLVAALDKELRENEIDPRDPSVADGLKTWERRSWLRLAKKHVINAPSPETIAAVIEAYRTRASARARGAAA